MDGLAAQGPLVILWKAVMCGVCMYLATTKVGEESRLPFVIYGGWVESQYLTVASNDLKTTREQIMNQREGLLSLINYLYEVMIESSAFYYNYDIKTIIVKLNNIKKIYDKVPDNNIDAQMYSDMCDRIKTMRSELIDPNKN